VIAELDDNKLLLGSGVDVMITIFWRFLPIFGKKMAFSQKPIL
jgi:hypothetical protein